MPDAAREVWITGLGILSCLGEGADAHWDALEEGRTGADAQRFAPYVVHPLAPVDFDKQIPKKGDQRQMEAWQRIGTYAAGLALDDAGVARNPEILERMDLMVAARGGERDLAVDISVLNGSRTAKDAAAYFNERMMSDLRPTLFLAQLANLLAGNISIVHGVAGSSRTIMGDENAGLDAVRIAAARIAAGQGEIALVGASNNAERKDALMFAELQPFAWKGEPLGVWERAPKGGYALGSAGAFLVLESSEHARARGARARAKLSHVASDWTRRTPGSSTAALARLFADVAPKAAPGACAIISGALGSEPATSEERAFLSLHPEFPVRAPATFVGCAMDVQFILNVVIAAMAVQRRRVFAGGDGSGFERPFGEQIRQAIVTAVGHWKGEGIALVEAVE